MSSSFGLRAGVHRNTKVYIEPSKSDCIAPSKIILLSGYKRQIILTKDGHTIKIPLHRKKIYANLPEAMADAATLNWSTKLLLSDGSP